MERLNQVYLSGSFLVEDDATVGVSDRGLLYADGLFETIRLADGRPYLLDRHLERLNASARRFNIPPPELDAGEIIKTLARENGVAEGAARLTLTRGEAKGPRPSPGGGPTVLIQTRPLPPGLALRGADGVRGVTLPWPLRAEGLPTQGHKTLAYLDSVLALGHAEEGEEPILETVDGMLSEGATSNLFWVRGEVLYTPGLATGCLPGIVRGLILEYARAEGIKAFEGNYPREALIDADEAFLTNSVAGILPLVALDEKTIDGGKPGPVTRRFQRRYEEALRAFRNAR